VSETATSFLVLWRRWERGIDCLYTVHSVLVKELKWRLVFFSVTETAERGGIQAAM
jgi:hypothetical protein